MGAAYTVEQTGTTVRSSYATAWQTPSLYERFDPCFGNADLEPESSRSWDVGVDQRIWNERIVTSATYFQTTTQDEIDWVFSPPTNPLCNGGGYVNINETFVQGVEVGATAALHPDVDASLAYTWLDAIDNETKERLDLRPVNQATASVTWRVVPEGSVNLGLRYRDRVVGFAGTSDQFWTADIRAAYDVLDNVTAHARVENLFDADYEESFGYGTPGISAYGGVTVRF